MRLTLTVILLLPLSGKASAQQSSPAAKPVDVIAHYVEYGNIRFRDEKAMLDRWASQFRQVPDSMIYISAYSGRQACPGEAEARARRAKSYLVKRHGIGADRVIWKDGGFRENLSVELWLKGRDERPPEPSPTVDTSEVKFLKGCRPGRRAARRKS